MTDNVFYEGCGIRITDTQIEGEKFVFQLDSVQGLEIKPTMLSWHTSGWLLIWLVATILSYIAPLAHLNWLWWVMSVCCVYAILHDAFYPAIYIRMATGKVRIDDIPPSEQQRVLNAFGYAKVAV